MNLRMCFSVMALLLAIQSSKAAESIAVVGVGTAPCGEYARFYKQDPKGADAAILSWVDGFISGLKIADLARGEPTKNVGSKSTAQRAQFIRSYCDSHPVGAVWQAAFNLYQSLTPGPPR